MDKAKDRKRGGNRRKGEGGKKRRTPISYNGRLISVGEVILRKNGLSIFALSHNVQLPYILNFSPSPDFRFATLHYNKNSPKNFAYKAAIMSNKFFIF